MGKLTKTIVNKAIIASEDFDLYFGDVDRIAIQNIYSDVTEALSIPTTAVDFANNEIDSVAHGYIDGTIGQFTTTDTLPTGLSLATDYYIFNKTADTFQVSLTEDGGSVAEVTNITCTAEGSVKEITDIDCIADIAAVAEVTSITAINEGSVKEITQLLCVADVDDSLDKKYFILQDDVGSVGFWYDTDNSGTQVDPALVAATDRQVEITTVTTGMTSTQVGTATYNAIVADSKFEAGVDGGAGTITVQSSTYGVKSAASEGNAGHTITEDTAGSGSAIDGTYWIAQDTDGSVAFWIDVDDSGTAEPVHGADRSVEITTISTADNAATIGGLLRTAVGADAKFTTSGSGAECIATNVDTEALTDTVDGDTGFTFSTTVQGVTAASLDGKYFILQDEVGSVAFYFDVDDSGTAEPVHGADRSVEITTVTTGMTATQVAGVVYTAIVADSKFEAGVDNVDGTMEVQSSTFGAKAAASEGDSGFTIAENTPGTSEVLDQKYFILEDADGTVAFYFDIDDSGSAAPVHGADREVEVTTITSGMAIGALGDALYTAITNDSKFEAGSNDNAGNLTIKNTDVEPITQQSAGDSGFTVVEGVNYSDVATFSDVGVGTHTFTPEAITGGSVTVQKSCDGINFINIEAATNITGDGTNMIELTPAYRYLRVKVAITTGYMVFKSLVTGWTK